MANGSRHIDVSTASIPACDTGMEYLKRKYMDEFGVIPRPPDYLLVARSSEEIKGTIGVNKYSSASGLRLLSIYSLEQEKSISGVDLEKIVEFGKWASDESSVSAILTYAAIKFSISLGYTDVLCEHSSKVNRVARRYGIIFGEVPGAKLDWSRVEEEYRLFYETNHPGLYIFGLTQAQKALKEYLKRLNISFALKFS